MTFLEMVQALAGECGVGSSPPAVENQSGESLRLVNWINRSWNEIQTMRDDWDWMRSSFILGNPIGSGGTAFTTAAGVYSYPLGKVAGVNCMVDADVFGMWDRYSFRCYTTTNATKGDEQPLHYISFEAFKDAYVISNLRNVQTRPVAVAIGPDKSVNVGPPSNGLYTIEADYWVKPSLMTTDTNEPTGLPEEYHMAIVYRAMRKYAGFQSAPEVYDRALKEGKPLEYKLVRNYSRGVKKAALA